MAYQRPDAASSAAGGRRPRSQDPRSIITPDAFHVDPQLLGAPLATPSRRLVAMLIDLILLGFLVNAPGWLFALLTAFVLFRATSRKSGAKGGVGRFFLRAAGALVAFVGVLSFLGAVSGLFFGGEERGRDSGPEDPVAQAEAAEGDGVAADGDGPPADGDGARGPEAATAVPSPVGAIRELVALGRAMTAEEARPHAAAAARFFAAQGDRLEDADDLRDALEELADLPLLSMNEEVVDVVEEEFRRVGVLPSGVEPPAGGEVGLDSLLNARRAAIDAGDPARADSLAREMALIAAADTLGRLGREVRSLREDNRALRERAEEAEETAERSPMGLLLDLIADEIGVSAGWAALYFTAMLALWRGRTPGKRALGIRVIRLDGQPLGWFASFERFGGYAAALATGTLGFFQILWDRNRQGVHDKISETVVIRDLAPEHVVRERVPAD
jgi:PAS domain-containing protein